MATQGMPNYEAVVRDDIIEWLQSNPPGVTIPLMRRLTVAEELGQKDIIRLLHKYIRGWAASGGKRVDMVKDIARNDEAVKMASEVLAPRRGV